MPNPRRRTRRPRRPRRPSSGRELPITANNIYSWFPKKAEYGYEVPGSDRSPQNGGTATPESPLRATADNPRGEATRAVESALDDAERGGPAPDGGHDDLGDLGVLHRDENPDEPASYIELARQIKAASMAEVSNVIPLLRRPWG